MTGLYAFEPRPPEDRPEQEQAPEATQPPEGVAAARLMLEVAATRSRLEAEIKAAHDRIEEARSPLTPAMRAAQLELGALVLDAQRELEEMEREHSEVLKVTRDTAVAEAARLLAAAFERASDARKRASFLSAQVTVFAADVDSADGDASDGMDG